MTKVARHAVRARELASSGSSPDAAWNQALAEVYSGEQLRNQLQHTCPKWAFAGLCNHGVVRGVPAGSCPAAADRRSGRYAVDALNAVRREASLLRDKRTLKARVFGRPGTADYRKPNDEVEVLLGLWESGSIEL